MTQKEKNEIKEGNIRLTSYGTGYAQIPGLAKEIRVEQPDLNTALHGDLVRIRISSKRGEPAIGKVTDIIARAKESFVGTIRLEDKLYFLEPEDDRMYADMIIPKEDLHGAIPGEKIVARIKTWNDPEKNPLGEVTQVLGRAGEHETEMRAIVFDKGFVFTFPEAVLKEAEEIKKNYKKCLEEERAVRRDLRSVPTFTIDPDDAKDFDDALSIQKLQNENFEVGIHIADVSFFVREGSALDKEAAHRGTSIYLVDRTIPMFPEILSNDLCSLREKEEKLAFSVILELSPQGDVRKRSFEKTIIRSHKRFTYKEAQKIIDARQGLFAHELSWLEELSRKLREKRFMQGAIEFEQDEIKFELDKSGKPLRVFKKERLPTHKLVEDFMILANNEVARFMTGHDKNVERTFVYRVHDLPDKDRMQELFNLLHALGHTVKKRPHKQPLSAHDINHILKDVEGKAHKNLVHLATIRAMAKAIYSTKNVGHFGLSLKHYTHFTSPIRRYPDVMVHHLLFKYLSGKQVPAERLGTYEALSRYSTQMEIAANDAERASIKYKQAEYMAEHIGKVYDGVITGVTENGIFVREEKTFAEGMIRLRDIRDDFYMLDKTKLRLTGARKKKTFALGDKIRIRLKKVNIGKRLIDYELA